MSSIDVNKSVDYVSERIIYKFNDLSDRNRLILSVTVPTTKYECNDLDIIDCAVGKSLSHKLLDSESLRKNIPPSGLNEEEYFIIDDDFEAKVNHAGHRVSVAFPFPVENHPLESIHYCFITEASRFKLTEKLIVKSVNIAIILNNRLLNLNTPLISLR